MALVSAVTVGGTQLTSNAEQVVKLVNEERAKAGLPALFSLTVDI